jgi:hypothetical protein
VVDTVALELAGAGSGLAFAVVNPSNEIRPKSGPEVT